MSVQRFQFWKQTFGSINRLGLLVQLFSCSHRHSSVTSRPFCVVTQNASFSPFSDESSLVEGLTTIFTQRHFSPETQELKDFGPKLRPGIVEAVLKSIRSWRIALMFFNWASDQSGYVHNCYTYNTMASILSRARQNAPLRSLAVELVNSQCWMTAGALGYFIRCLGSQGLVEEANLLFGQMKKMGLCVPNNYSYNCLLEAISRSSSSGLIEMRLTEMCESGWEPDKYTMTSLLQCYCNAGDSEKALEVYNRIDKLGWLDSHALTILLISLCKSREVDKAFELIESMENRNIRLNEKTFYILIHGFAKESRADKALQLFDKMRKLGFSPGISIYDVLIGELCDNKDLDGALYLFSEMNKSGVHPDVGILQKLASSHPGESEMMHLIEQTQGQLQPEAMVILYNSLLKSHVTSGSVGKAYHLIRAMMGDEPGDDIDINKLFKDKKLVRPDTTSFHIVLDGLCETGKLDVALALFRDMDKINCKRSVLIYNNLIDYLCKSNRTEECYELLREMKLSGFKPSHFTYNSIFGCLSKAGDFAGATAIVKEMHFDGHEPWIKHTTLLIRNLWKHGKVVEVTDFLGTLVEEGIRPNIIPYSEAINGLIKTKQVERALELFRDISNRGHCGDVVAYNIMINGLCKAGRILEAQDFLNEMVEKGLVPSVVTYNSIIDGWCKAGDLDQVMRLLSAMLGKQQQPNLITFTTLIDGSCNAGRPDIALELWKDMNTKGCFPTRITYMALINGLCKCGKPDVALIYFKEMEEKEMNPDVYVYFALIDTFISTSNPLLAFDILKKLLHIEAFQASVGNYHQYVRDAILKLSKDDRTSSDIKRLIEERSTLVISSNSGDGS